MSGQQGGYQTSGVPSYGAPQFQPSYAGQNGFQASNYMPTMGYQGSTPQGTYQPSPMTFNFGGYPVGGTGMYGGNVPPMPLPVAYPDVPGSGGRSSGAPEYNASGVGIQAPGVNPNLFSNANTAPGAAPGMGGIPMDSGGNPLARSTAPSVLPPGSGGTGLYGNQPGQNGLVFTNGQFGFGNGSVAQLAPGTAAMLGFRNNGQGQWVNAQGQVVGRI